MMHASYVRSEALRHGGTRTPCFSGGEGGRLDAVWFEFVVALLRKGVRVAGSRLSLSISLLIEPFVDDMNDAATAF